MAEVIHNGRSAFRVYYRKGLLDPLKAKSRWFQTRQDAEAHISHVLERQSRFGEIAASVKIEELVEARAAAQVLEGTGLSLVEAAKHVRAALDQTLQSQSFEHGMRSYLSEIWAKFKDRRESQPRREPKHWRSVKRSVAKLSPLYARSLREIRPDDIRPLLGGMTSSSLKGHLRNLHAAFGYCVEQGWLEDNPIRRLKKMRADLASAERKIQTFTAAEVSRIMDAVVRVDRRFAPYFAVCFFAGVRPEAVAKMSWSDVSENGHLYIPNSANKTGHAYTVEINPTLRAWLDWWHKTEGPSAGPLLPFSASSLKRFRNRIIREAGIQRWIQDGARKTFATAHRETFKRKELTAEALGHRGTATLDSFYDSRLMTRQDAHAYWRIVPEDVFPAERSAA